MYILYMIDLIVGGKRKAIILSVSDFNKSGLT